MSFPDLNNAENRNRSPIYSHCLDGSDEDPNVCRKKKVNNTELNFLNCFRFDCIEVTCDATQIRCPVAGGGPVCISKSYMCDGARYTAVLYRKFKTRHFLQEIVQMEVMKVQIFVVRHFILM